MTTLEKTSHEPMNKAAMETHPHHTQRLASKIGHFLWHFVQMVVVMEAGMMIYMKLILPLLTPSGFQQWKMAHPILGYWLMVTSMTLPMIALMRIFHKSTWCYSLEMTAAMLAPLAALTVLVQYSLIPIQTLYGIGDPVMFLAMAAYMFFGGAQHAHGGQPQNCHKTRKFFNLHLT